MQSVSFRQGPLLRAMRLATVRMHTVAGPVARAPRRDRRRHRMAVLRGRVARGGRCGRAGHHPPVAAGRGDRVRDGRLGIGIIGAGRVGPVLGAALAGAGHAITGIASSSPSNLERAEAVLPGVPGRAHPRADRAQRARAARGAAGRTRVARGGARRRRRLAAGPARACTRRRASDALCWPPRPPPVRFRSPSTPRWCSPARAWTSSACARAARRSPRRGRCFRSPRPWSSRWGRAGRHRGGRSCRLRGGGGDRDELLRIHRAPGPRRAHRDRRRVPGRNCVTAGAFLGGERPLGPD